MKTMKQRTTITVDKETLTIESQLKADYGISRSLAYRWALPLLAAHLAANPVIIAKEREKTNDD